MEKTGNEEWKQRALESYYSKELLCPVCKKEMPAKHLWRNEYQCSTCYVHFTYNEPQKTGNEVEISIQDLFEDAERAMVKLLPPDDFEQDDDCATLHYNLNELKLVALRYQSALSIAEARNKELEQEVAKLKLALHQMDNLDRFF